MRRKKRHKERELTAEDRLRRERDERDQTLAHLRELTEPEKPYQYKVYRTPVILCVLIGAVICIVFWKIFLPIALLGLALVSFTLFPFAVMMDEYQKERAVYKAQVEDLEGYKKREIARMEEIFAETIMLYECLVAYVRDIEIEEKLSKAEPAEIIGFPTKVERFLKYRKNKECK